MQMEGPESFSASHLRFLISILDIRKTRKYFIRRKVNWYVRRVHCMLDLVFIISNIFLRFYSNFGT